MSFDIELMSDNAKRDWENNIKPLRDWTKRDLINTILLLNDGISRELLSDTPFIILKSMFLKYHCFHHIKNTKYACSFFKVYKEFIEMADNKSLTEIINEKKQMIGDC